MDFIIENILNQVESNVICQNILQDIIDKSTSTSLEISKNILQDIIDKSTAKSFETNIEIEEIIIEDNDYIEKEELKYLEKLEKEVEELKKIAKKEKEDITYFYDNMVCYYINLDRRKDRLEKIQKELEYFKYIFKCERVRATDGQELKMIDYINKQIVPPNPRFGSGRKFPFKRGHLGCMISHLNCWKKFLKSKYKYCLILEDDILINKKYFDKIFYKIMDKLDTLNFDWLSLGRQSLGYTKFYNGEVINNIFYKPIFQGSGNHAYIINKKSAKDLVRYLEQPKMYNLRINYRYPSWPLDCWEQHKRFFARFMKRQLKILSIIPENFDIKHKFPISKKIFSKSEDFLFFARGWGDSDTCKN